MERGTIQTTNQKVSAGTVKMKYRPVSNLGFISKIEEKVTLNNSLNIATKIAYYQNINQHIGSITVVKPA